MSSVKCYHCGKWIGSLEVHEDCARKMDEDRAYVESLRGRADDWKATADHRALVIADLTRKIERVKAILEREGACGFCGCTTVATCELKEELGMEP